MLTLFWPWHVLFSFRLIPTQLVDNAAVCGLWGGQWPVNLRAARKSTTSPLPAEGQYGGKALWVNMGKTKVLYLGQGSVCFRSLAKTPAACVSRAWAQTPIFCGGCSSWIHKKCSCIPGPLNPPLKPDPSLRCKRCTGQARPMAKVTVGREKVEVVPSFCYLGDCLSSGGGCELAIITRGVVAGQVNFSNWLQGTAVLNCHQAMRKFESFTMMTNDFRLTNARQI